MIINSIELNNIGPYLGLTTFQLKTDNDRNIVLIGGKNGAGKTTLLQAIKYGVFGAQAFGYKTNNNTYFEYIAGMLNVTNSNFHHIKAELSVIENYQAITFTILREWSSSPELNEKVSVYKNGSILLDLDETQSFFNRLKINNSTELISGFIFDGEHIGQVADSNQIGIFLKSTLQSLFNISVIESVERDLSTYLNKKAQNSGDEGHIFLMNIYREIESLKGQQKSKENLLYDFNQEIKRLENVIKELETEIGQYVKLSKADRFKTVKEIRDISNKEQKRRQEIRNLLENSLAIHLILPLLKKANKQIKIEKPVKYYNVLLKIEEYLNKENIDFKMELQSKVKNIKQALFLTDHEEEVFNYRYYEHRDNIKKIKYLMKNETFNNNLENLKKRIDIDDSEHNRELFNTIDQTNQQLLNAKEKKEAILQDIDNLKILLDKAHIDYKEKSEEIKKQKIKDYSFQMGSRLLNMLAEFEQLTVDEKITTVSKLAAKTFKSIHSKGKYIHEIYIDQDYNVKLIDESRRVININNLSAGEKQLLISSIIFAAYKVSGRREMFIFDTPLARLDQENRYLYIEEIIKKISKQVVILSTDSEFVNESLDQLKDKIKHSYHLKYDENFTSTQVINGYFGRNTYE